MMSNYRDTDRQSREQKASWDTPERRSIPWMGESQDLGEGGNGREMEMLDCVPSQWCCIGCHAAQDDIPKEPFSKVTAGNATHTNMWDTAVMGRCYFAFRKVWIKARDYDTGH
jgi:hypothetical protein